jgi:hypothetical protein
MQEKMSFFKSQEEREGKETRILKEVTEAETASPS